MGSNSPTNNRFDKLSRLLSRFLIPVGLPVFATPFIALLFYSSMNTDDFPKATLAFCNGDCVRQPSILAITRLYYTMQNARWVTTLVQSFVMSKINLVGSYGWLLLLVMLINLAALAYFFANFLRVSRNQALLAAAVFYAAWLADVVSPGDSVYWLTTAIEYQFTVSTMLILAGLLCKSRQTPFSYAAIVVLAIAVPAQHEIAGSFLLVCLLAAAVAAQVQKLETRQWWLSLGLIAFSFAVVMFSPGKSLGLAQGHQHHLDVAHVMPYARHAVNLGVSWFINPAVLLCAFCMPLVLWPRAESSAESQYRPPRWLALVGLGAMGALLVEFAAAEMTSGYEELPPRTIGWFQFVFWLLLVCVILVGLPELSQIKFSPGSRIGMSMLLMATLLGSGNFRLAEQDWRGPARSYWRSSVARLRQRGGSLEFEPLPRKPTLFKVSSLATNTKCWVNQTMAFYLGANTIVSKDPTENPARCGMAPI